MAYLRMTIADWDLDVDSREGRAIVDLIARDGAAVFRAQPGFVRYRLMQAGPRRTIAVAEWESEDLGVPGATRYRDWMAAAGVRDHITLETEAGPIIVSTDARSGGG